MIENIASRNADVENMVKDMNSTVSDIDALKLQLDSEIEDSVLNIQNKATELYTSREDRVNSRNDWITNAGQSIQDAITDFSVDTPGLDENGTLGEIAGNTKDIASNTAEISEEDLKYLIDLAERDTVNRFTTVPLTINLTNNNNINGEQDIDGIVDQVSNKLTTRLEEELEYVADGIHE